MIITNETEHDQAIARVNAILDSVHGDFDKLSPEIDKELNELSEAIIAYESIIYTEE